MYDTGHKTTNLAKRFILTTALLMNVNRKNRYLNDKYSLTFVYNIYNCGDTHFKTREGDVNI